MASRSHDEIERKYEVDEQALLPTLHELPGVARVAQPVEHRLEAVYFDTDGLSLTAVGATLRRRTGGEDAGWHLKIPIGSDTRREHRAALGRAVKTPPKSVLQPVRVHVRDQKLAPVATVNTRRTVHQLLGEGGVVLAEVCDDQVSAEGTGADAARQEWREWEIELVDGSPDLLAAADAMIVAAGARPAAHESKVARILGGTELPSSQRQVARSAPTREGASVDLLMAYVHEQIDALKARDPEVRRNAPGSVHKMRIATRRLRSALATYRPLLEPGAPEAIRQELKWLAGVLGGARDAQVMRERLKNALADEPAELVLGSVARTVDDELRIAYRDAHAGALEALDSTRYFRLVDALDDFLATPTLTESATTPVEAVVPGLLRHELKRVRKRVKRAAAARGSQLASPALHDVRKAAKQLRYAAESAIVVFGNPAEELANQAKGLQQILGQHQDSVVCRDLLRQLGVQAHLRGDNAFTYGRLHGLEQARAASCETQFEQAWKHFKKPRFDRWGNA